MEQQLDKDFARASCVQAVHHFADQVGVAAPIEAVSSAVEYGLRQAEIPLGGASDDFLDIDERRLRLELRHECRFVGCSLEDCSLCKQLLHKRCTSDIAARSYVDAELQAKCERAVRVVVVDCLTGLPVKQEILDVNLEMTIIDGARYETELSRLPAGGSLSPEQLEALMLLKTIKANPEPLLLPDSPDQLMSNGRVGVALQRGGVQLPGLRLKASSETVLNGKRSPFRLLVRALDLWGRPANIEPAVSNSFVVTTRRTRGDAKAEVPSLHDSVKVIENIGSQTVRKLAELTVALQSAGVEWNLPPQLARIETVGQLKELIQLTELERELQSGLQRALGLKKDQWAAMQEHLSKAITQRPLLRAWFPTDGSPLGLLFGPHYGESDAFNPWELLHRPKGGSAAEACRVDRRQMERADAKNAIRSMISLKQAACAAWWQPRHPGWHVGPWMSRDDVPWDGAPGASSSDQPAATGKRDAGQISRLLSSQLRSYEVPRKRAQPAGFQAPGAEQQAWPGAGVLAGGPVNPAQQPVGWGQQVLPQGARGGHVPGYVHLLPLQVEPLQVDPLQVEPLPAAPPPWQQPQMGGMQPPSHRQAGVPFLRQEHGTWADAFPGQDDEPPSAFAAGPSVPVQMAAADMNEPVVTLPSPRRLDSNAIPFPRGWSWQPQSAPGGAPANLDAQLEDMRNSFERLSSKDEGFQLSVLQGGKPLGSFNVASLSQLDSLLLSVVQAENGLGSASDLPPVVSGPPRT